MNESAPRATPPPPIIISYSKEDEKWKDQLVSLFPTDVDLQFMFNRVQDQPQVALFLLSQLVNIYGKLTERAALVVLLSPSYLISSILIDGTDRLLELERQYGLTILPVLLQDCSVDAVPFLRNRHLMTSDGKPIAETSPAEQARALQNLASRILDATGVAEPPPKKSSEQTPSPSRLSETVPAKILEKFTWTTEVEKILDGAKVLGLDKDGRTTVSALSLLFAFAEVGQLNPSDTKTPQFLWGEITRRGVKFYERAFKFAFPSLRTRRPRKGTTRPSLRLTRDAVELLELATSLSLQTIKLQPPAPNVPPPLSSGYIAGRHLLAALMLGPESTSSMLTTITDLEGLRERFFDIIDESNLPDDRNEWRSILQIDARKPESTSAPTQKSEQDTELESLHSKTPAADRPLSSPETEAELLGKGEPTHIEEEVEPAADEFLKPILAGFATDHWIGKDLLNIEGDVNALASLVSAWSVEPPLSIGLFGDWGSGKSHFMRQMRQQVEKLSRMARKSPKKQNELGYYKNIVQIEFNAWHYIEGNLWASLVDHIFANLRVSEKEKRDIVAARRDDLMNKLGVKEEIEKKLKSKIEERKTELTAKSTEANTRAADAVSRKDDASTALAGFRNEAESQLNQLAIPSFSDEDQKLLQRFGIQPSALQTAGDVRKQYQKARTFWNRVSTQWKLFWTDPKVKRRWFYAALLALIPLVGGYLLTRGPESLKLPAGIVAVFGFIATFLNAAKPAWDQFRKGLKALEEQDEAIELERQKRIAELQAEVNALTKTILDAENEAKSIRTEITDLENQINRTNSSTILAEFIEDRAAASDYRRHLGLLALIRRDFEKLRDLFDQQRMEEKEGQETHNENRINRIILYIDDLDRCGPKRVVEVLQAIHLLLAFPIFVVVVGVDARWVTRSLQESYEWLRLEDDDDRKKETNDDSDERSEQGATPHDYLEKIFQIPFWLAPMGKTQCETFIEGLTEQIRYKPSAVDEDSNGNKRTETGAPSTTTGFANKELTQQTPASGNGDQTVAGSSAGLLEKDVERPESTLVQLNTASVSSAVEDSGNERASARLSPEVQSQTHIGLSDNPQDIEAINAASELVNSETGDHDHQSDQADEKIDLSPQSLTLGDKEIEYMTSLAKLIGRSPRAVKRFLNCYRFIKVSLPPASLKKFVQDGASYEYRAVMILLGIITGAPTASPYVIEELENWTWTSKTAPTLKNFLNKLEKNTDLTRTADWPRLKAFLTGFDNDSAEMFTAVRAITPRVSRFSFRIARAEAAGPKRPGRPSKPKGSP